MHFLQERMTLPLDDLRTRIERLVNPVPEPHETRRIVPVLDLFDEFFNASSAFDAAEHLHDLLVRTAVQRTRKSRNAGGNRRIEIDLRTADRAHRGR